MALREDLATDLLQIKAITLSPQNPFTWASGILSPIYCDNRVALSHPRVRSKITAGFCELYSEFEPADAISGVATAGIAHGALLAADLDLPFSYVRSGAKGHGKQNRIEGKVDAGQKILVVEDLISTGSSSISAVTALREAGAEVVGVVAIFQYNFAEASEAFRKAGCPFSTLSSYQALLEMARTTGMFTEEDQKLLESWYENPREWSGKPR